MESTGSGMFKIDKLSESNFHVWKQKIQLILVFKELDTHIEDFSETRSESMGAATWTMDDAKAKALIGLTLGDDRLEHVRDCKTAREMWFTILDLFQRKTLSNKLTTHRRFYSTKMEDSEKSITFISSVRQLAPDFKTMDVSIDNQEVAMTIL